MKGETKELTRKQYDKELRDLQEELVRMAEWIHLKGLKVVVIFEGRDTPGKGGTIKRIMEPLNPTIARLPR